MADETKIVGLKVGVDTGDSVNGVKNLESAAGSLLSGLNGLEGGIGLATKALGGLAAGLAALELGEYIKDATMLAARVETLGVVMNAVGKNAGYTSREMEGFSKSIAAQGITTEASRQATVRLTQAHVDLRKSSELARIAQDAAVIANTNSSDAFDRMTTGIATQQAVILHHMGLMVNFEKGYQEYAATLGKSTTELTENEKVQSRVNEVMKAGEGIAGSYEAAMGTAGKQVTSLSRYFEEIKLAVGEPFTQTFSLLLLDIADNLKGVLTAMKDNKGELVEWGNAIADTYRFARDEIKLLAGDIAGLQSLYTGATQIGLKGAELGTRFLTIGQFGGGFGAMADAAGKVRAQQLDAYHRGRAADDAYEASLAYGGPTLDPREAMLLQMAKDNKVKPPKAGPAPPAKDTDTDTTDQLWAAYTQGLYGFNNQLDKLNPNLTDFQKSLLSVDDSLNKQLEKFAAYKDNPGVQAYVQSLKNAAAGVKQQLTENERVKNGGSLGRDMTLNEQSQFDRAAMYNKWEVADADYRNAEELATFNHNTVMAGLQQSLDQQILLEEAKKTGDYEQQLIDQYEFEKEQAELQLQWTLDHTALSETQKERILAEFRAKRLAAEVKLQGDIHNNELKVWRDRLGYAATGTNAMLDLTNSLVTLTGNKSKEMFILQKMAAVANATVNTALGVTKVLAEVPYPYDFVVAGMVAAAGAAQIATIAAAEMGSGTGTSTTSLSGTGGGTVSSPVVTQPASTVQTQQQGSVTIQIMGNVIGEDKWVEENLIPALTAAGSRNITISH